MQEEVIELKDAVIIEKDVERRITNVGVYGLSIERAQQLGVMTRIANLLCVAHASIMAANMVFGSVDYVLSIFGGRKNEIAKAMNDFDKAYDKFISFWTNYYAHGNAGIEMNGETQALYRNIMHWSQLPMNWKVGDPQRVDDVVDSAIKVSVDNSTITFRNATLNEEVKECKESWCVLKYDKEKCSQVCIEENMDKASAMMVAKRLSAEDTDNVYTAGMVQDIVKKETVVVPVKCFMANETVGSITKSFK